MVRTKFNITQYNNYRVKEIKVEYIRDKTKKLWMLGTLSCVTSPFFWINKNFILTNKTKIIHSSDIYFDFKTLSSYLDTQKKIKERKDSVLETPKPSLPKIVESTLTTFKLGDKGRFN